MTIIQKKHALKIKDLGVIDYDQACLLQKQYVQTVLDGGPSTVLLCEHAPVLTLGRMAQKQHILISQEELEARDIKICDIDRGGDITLHAPGQLVMYPILDLNHFGKDLHHYLRRLEQVAIDLLGDFGIVASRFSGQTGVWVDKDKIASIGIGVRKWISYHGLSINVNTDLSYYSMIKPCGLDVRMTSIAKLLGKQIDMIDVKKALISRFSQNFQISNYA